MKLLNVEQIYADLRGDEAEVERLASKRYAPSPPQPPEQVPPPVWESPSGLLWNERELEQLAENRYPLRRLARRYRDGGIEPPREFSRLRLAAAKALYFDALGRWDEGSTR